MQSQVIRVHGMVLRVEGKTQSMLRLTRDWKPLRVRV